MLLLKNLLLVSIATTLSVNAQTPAKAAPASTTAAPALGNDIPLAGWMIIGDKTKAFGPKEEAGTITFTGAGFGDKGKNGAVYFTKTELVEGSTIELNAKVTFVGVSGMGNFRYGIFQKRSKDHSRGWLGYCAYAGIDKKFPKGGLFASEAGNDANFDSATARTLGESLGAFKNIKDGSYNLTMEMTRTGTSIEAKSTLTPDLSPSTPALQYTVTDSAPTTFEFDAFGFSTHQVLSADSIQFSNVTLRAIKK
jgi:hypothetical protein